MNQRWISLLLLCASFAAAENLKIVLSGRREAAAYDELRAAAPANVRLVKAPGAELIKEIADADGVVGAVNAKAFREARRLRWVQISSAGAENYLFPEMVESQTVLTNCKIIQGPNIADHAFALLLALTRALPAKFKAQEQGAWTYLQHEVIELQGRTAVIVGVGGIGMQIAQRAAGFGMRSIGVDPKDVPYLALLEKTVPPDRLDAVLPQADVVFLAAPSIPATHGMMGARQFSLMKKGSYLIAVSRGTLYDTDSLMKALDSGQLAGAGLDVTNPEPLPPNHPLWKFKNVVITPHMAGDSDQVHPRRIALWKENIGRFARGEQLLNVVDKKKGY